MKPAPLPKPKQSPVAPSPTAPATLFVERQLAALKLLLVLAEHHTAITALITAFGEFSPITAIEDPLLTVAEGAALAGRHIELVRRWCAGGQLGYYDRLARCWRFRRSELIALMIKRHGVDGLPAALRKNVV